MQDTKLDDLAKAVSHAAQAWQQQQQQQMSSGMQTDEGSSKGGLGVDSVKLKRVVVWGSGFHSKGCEAAIHILKAAGVEDVVSYAGFSVIYSLWCVLYEASLY